VSGHIKLNRQEIERAAAARANALRFAELARDEPDEAMRAYFRHVAVSWTQAAERHEFLAEIYAKERAIALSAPERQATDGT
jgi:hypothetical protein